MEIRLDFARDGKREQRSLSITMRTPGHDFELATGFLVSEGIVRRSEDLVEVRHCGPPAPGFEHSNVTRVVLAEGLALDWSKLERHFYTTSSCGVCGKSSLAERLKALIRQNENAAVVGFEIVDLFAEDEVP